MIDFHGDPRFGGDTAPRRVRIVRRTVKGVSDRIVRGKNLFNGLARSVQRCSRTISRLATTRQSCSRTIQRCKTSDTRTRTTQGGEGGTRTKRHGTKGGLRTSGSGTIEGVATITSTVGALNRTSVDLSSFKDTIKSLISALSTSKDGVNNVVTTVLTVLSRVKRGKLRNFINGVLRAIVRTTKKL